MFVYEQQVFNYIPVRMNLLNHAETDPSSVEKHLGPCFKE